MPTDDPFLQDALVNFHEALRKGAWRKRAEQASARLDDSLRKGFREQGRLFVAGLRKELRGYFAEGFAEHAAFLEANLREALTPADWLRIWIEVVDGTAKMFEAPIQRAAEIALEAGIKATILEIGMKLSFDLENPRAVAYLKDYGARQVTKISETTREYIHTLMNQAIEEGWSYKRTAEALIERFEEFAIGKPQSHIDSRAHLIAVTETGNAYAEGNLLVAQELKAAGLDMEKSWDTVGDAKVSDGCKENEAAGWIEVDQNFPSGHLRPLRFPGCRCDTKYRVKKEQ